MSLGKRLISTGGDAVCNTETTDIFGDSSGVALYSLDYDASEASGSYDGTPSNVDFGVGGQINTGARFTRLSSSHIDTGYTLPASSTASFSWWMKCATASAPLSNDMVLFADRGTSGNYNFSAFIDGNSQNLGVVVANGSGSYFFSTLVALGDLSTDWIHLVVTINGTALKIYKNGSEVLSETSSATFSTTAGSRSIIIGREGHSTSTNNAYGGDFDQFRIFSSTLTSDQVSTLYAETACVHTATTTDNYYPLADGSSNAVAYYKFDNSSEDEKGTSSSETDIEYRFGRYGQAAIFDGANSVITNSSVGTALNVSAFTFSLWFKTNVNDSTDRILISSFDSSGNARFYASVVNSGLSVVIYGSSSTYIQNFTSTVEIGNWYHLAVTHTGTTTTVYLNGIAITPSGTSGSAVAIKIASSPQPLTFGQLQGNIGTYPFSGSIDQARIFTSALTSSQVSQLYNEKGETDTSNFKAVLYEGSGAAQYVSNVGFQPDLIWLKNRTDASKNHKLYDSIRNEVIESNTTAISGSTTQITSLDANGFTLGGSASVYNGSGKDYVAWTWKAGGEAVNIGVNSITGSTPSIASDVSANTAAGFSIVKYTGNGTDGATVGHGLGVAPNIVIVKDLDSNNYWCVGGSTVGDGENLYLNVSTQRQTRDRVKSVQTNTFTLGNHFETNSTNNFIAYCWHSVTGYSKIGTYEGDGTNDYSKEITGLGFDPSFVMVKNIDSSGSNWEMIDTRRGDEKNLYANANYSENANSASSYGSGKFITDGFEVARGSVSSSVHWNKYGDTYLYMAFK